MKILKYLLGLIAVLVIVFLAAGFMKSTVSYECSTEVNKPLAEAWAVTQDEEKLGEWLEGLQKVEPISGEPGTVGAVSDIHFTQDGQEMVIRETITEIVPNESISMTFDSDFMKMDYKMGMESTDGGTKITSWTTTEGNNIIAKSMMAMMSGTIQAQEETNLANLKSVIESNTKDYFPAPEVSDTVAIDTFGSIE